MRIFFDCGTNGITCLCHLFNPPFPHIYDANYVFCFSLLSFAAFVHFCFYTIERYSASGSVGFPVPVVCRQVAQADRNGKWLHFSRASIQSLPSQHTLAPTELEPSTSSSKLVISHQLDLAQILQFPPSVSAFSIRVKYPKRLPSLSTGYRHLNTRSFQHMPAFWGRRRALHSSSRESRIFKMVVRSLY